MINNFLLVGFGGFLGSGLRYLVQQKFIDWSIGAHWATMTVNLVGSLLIGILAAWLVKDGQVIWKLLLITGFCGGFTTFSSFSLDNFQLLKDGQTFTAITYTALSLFAGLALTFAGFFLTQKMLDT
jgi:CrcB protein